ncbi:MAG: hypothetical protein WBH31_04650 [Promethearchaeia archaeon]
MNKELKETYNISLRMLAEKKYIPHNAAKCAQKNFKRNISEAKLLRTLDYLEKKKYNSPTLVKLSEIFRENTFTRVKEIKPIIDGENIYNLESSENESCIIGTGQIYIKNNEIKE